VARPYCAPGTAWRGREYDTARCTKGKAQTYRRANEKRSKFFYAAVDAEAWREGPRADRTDPSSTDTVPNAI
jgi:hypothetical protein